jgi:ribonuclease E
VNLEAVPEIARQLRLRDLGGIIVIDFIDMSQKHHKQEVEKEMKAVLRDDRAKTKMLRISGLGLLELTRQRLKSVLGTGEYLECPLCDGQGKIRSPETSALSVYRRIKSLLIRSDVSEVRATVPAKVAEYLLNNMRAQLVEIERQHDSHISILVKQALPDKDISVEAVKEEALEQPAPEVLVTPTPVLEVVEAVEETTLAEAEARKPKPGRRRRRPRKKPTSGTEERVITIEEEVEPFLEATPPGETPEEETLAVESLPEITEGVRPEEDLLGPERSAEPQAKEIPMERAAPEPIETTTAQEAKSEEPAAAEEAKKEAKPRRKSWLQDFLPFS